MPKAQPDYSDWLTKAEAAQIMGCSEKTVARKAKAGEIQSAARRQAGTHPVSVYHPGDVGRAKGPDPGAFVMKGFAFTGKPEPGASVVPAGANGKALETSETPAHSTNLQELLISFLGALAKLQPPERIPLDKKLFLTLDEAAEYSGLPKSYIRERIKIGDLRPISRRWLRIPRVELEAL